MTSSATSRVYKILSDNDWQTAHALGHTKTALDEGDGYVHLSTREQVLETLHLHYKGQTGVRLFEYVPEPFGDALKWEESRGGQLFPHLYGSLRLDAAKRQWLLESAADGLAILPRDIDS